MKSDLIQGILAIALTLLGFGYVGAVSFLPIPTPNQHTVDIVTGFIIGTALTTVVGFYFGSSKGSADKTQALTKTP